MAELHEPREKLAESTLDLHRAINSLIEELDAIDWYQQRVDASSDEALQRILAHNRDEEVEHAAMVLEYLRRRLPVLDRMLREYLFTEGEITSIEETKKRAQAPAARAEADPPPAPAPAPPVLGSLKPTG